jgi:hypothetical protein
MNKTRTILYISIGVYALFHGIVFSANELILSGPPLGFIGAYAILSTAVILPLSLYLLYSKILNEESKGLMVVSLISLVMLYYIVTIALAAKTEVDKISSQEVGQYHADWEKIENDATNHINKIYFITVFISSLLIPLIDWMVAREKLSFKDGMKLLILSIGIHVLVIIWLFIVIFMIGLILLFTSW